MLRKSSKKGHRDLEVKLAAIGQSSSAKAGTARCQLATENGIDANKCVCATWKTVMHCQNKKDDLDLSKLFRTQLNKIILADCIKCMQQNACKSRCACCKLTRSKFEHETQTEADLCPPRRQEQGPKRNEACPMLHRHHLTIQLCAFSS